MLTCFTWRNFPAMALTFSSATYWTMGVTQLLFFVFVCRRPDFRGLRDAAETWTTTGQRKLLAP